MTAAIYVIGSNNLKLIDGEEQQESTEEEGEGEEFLPPSVTQSEAVQTV